MKKKLGMAIVLALGLVLVTAGMAPAAKYMDLKGTWVGDYYDTIYFGDYLIRGQHGMALVVADQDANGAFYGTFQDYPLVGTIATNKVISACVRPNRGNWVITAKLTGKKISGTSIGFDPGDIAITSGRFELIKE